MTISTESHKLSSMYITDTETVPTEEESVAATATATEATNKDKLVSNGIHHSETKVPPSSSLLHRSLHDQPYKVTSAKGIYLTLSNGQQIIDACGGAAVTCIGHGNTEVLDAVIKQMQEVSYVHSLTYTTDAPEDLASFFIDTYGRKHGLEKAYFVGSGSEAMDAALKLARQYFFELEGPETTRNRFVARRQAYHGNTLGGMAVSSNLPRKKPYSCLQVPCVSWTSPAYAYQYSRHQTGETEEKFADRLVRELEEHFLEVGPQNIIAFVAETLVGATSGCTPAPKGYFQGVRRVCDKYGILLILDEIMCGTGRTGTMFAFEQEGPGVYPDLMTLGKGLGGGYSSVAAVLAHQKVISTLRRGTASFNHGHTYQAHPVNCAAALAVQKIVHRDGLMYNCRIMGQRLSSLLQSHFASRKYIGEIRGRGLFWGIEFVADKTNREPFDPKMLFGPTFQQLAFDHGVAVYPGSGTVDGTKGDHIIISPPYNVTEEELQKIIDVLVLVYEKMESKLDGLDGKNQRS